MIFFTSFLSKQNSISNIIWPSKTYLDDYSWEQIIRLYNWTKEDLHEYEVSLFSIDDDVIFSPIDRGNRQRVISSHNAEVKYIPDNKTMTYLKQMSSDSVIVRKRLVKFNDLPKNISVKYLFNFHTHPHYGSNEIKQEFIDLFSKSDNTKQGEENLQLYSFFSGTDVNTLLSGNTYCIGLITDRVWILCKTRDVAPKLTELQVNKLHKITLEKIANPDIPLIDIANDFLSEIRLKLYTARFREPLELLN